MARRTKEFSERDRVPFVALNVGERFVHGGKLWAKSGDGEAGDLSAAYEVAAFPFKRIVIVSRKSKIAYRYLSARRAGQEAVE